MWLLCTLLRLSFIQCYPFVIKAFSKSIINDTGVSVVIMLCYIDSTNATCLECVYNLRAVHLLMYMYR